MWPFKKRDKTNNAIKDLEKEVKTLEKAADELKKGNAEALKIVKDTFETMGEDNKDLEHSLEAELRAEIEKEKKISKK